MVEMMGLAGLVTVGIGGGAALYGVFKLLEIKLLSLADLK